MTAFAQAPLRPGGWTAALAELRARLNCVGAALVRIDGRANRLWLHASGALPAVQNRYLELCGEAADADPRMAYAREAPRDEIWSERDLPDSARDRAAPLYRVLAEAGADYMRGVVLARDGDEVLLLATAEPAASAAPDGEAATRLAAALPSVRHGLEVERALARAGADRAAQLATALEAPVVLLTARGRAVACSEAAAAILAGSEALRLVDGRLAARPAELARAVEAAVAEASAEAPRQSAVRLADGLGLRFLPLPPPARLTLGETPAVAMVLASDMAEPRLAAMARRAGLSPAETEIVSLLIQGLSVDAVAERRGAARETVRTQLKSIYLKTGSASRADLLRAYYDAASQAG